MRRLVSFLVLFLSTLVVESLLLSFVAFASAEDANVEDVATGTGASAEATQAAPVDATPPEGEQVGDDGIQEEQDSNSAVGAEDPDDTATNDDEFDGGTEFGDNDVVDAGTGGGGGGGSMLNNLDDVDPEDMERLRKLYEQTYKDGVSPPGQMDFDAMQGGGNFPGGGAGAGGVDQSLSQTVKAISSSTWIISATSYMGMQGNNPRQRNENSQLPDYVQWACYHQITQTPQPKRERLECCQQIYERMLQESDTLCWEKHECPGIVAHHSRTKFLHFCTEYIVPVPRLATFASSISSDTNSNEASKAAVTSLYEPRFSLSRIPQVDHLEEHAADPSSKNPYGYTWRQYIWMSTAKRGQYHYNNIVSPVRLSDDPIEHFPLDDDVAQAVSKSVTSVGNEQDSEPSFQAKMTTVIQEDDDSDQRRTLAHGIKLNLSSIAATKENGWKTSMRILYFLPEDVKLRDDFGKCKTSCKASCKVAMENPSIKSVIGKDEVIAVSVTVESSTGHDVVDGRCEVDWTARIVLDDEDEDLLMSAPVLQAGVLHVEDEYYAMQIRDNDFPIPLTTNLEYASPGTGSLHDEL